MSPWFFCYDLNQVGHKNHWQLAVKFKDHLANIGGSTNDYHCWVRRQSMMSLFVEGSIYMFFIPIKSKYINKCANQKKKWSSGSNGVDSGTTGHHFCCVFYSNFLKSAPNPSLSWFFLAQKKKRQKGGEFHHPEVDACFVLFRNDRMKTLQPLPLYWLVRDPGSLRWFSHGETFATNSSRFHLRVRSVVAYLSTQNMVIQWHLDRMLPEKKHVTISDACAWYDNEKN